MPVCHPTSRQILAARPVLSAKEVITLAAQLQTQDDSHPDAALIRLDAQLRICSVDWMVSMFDDGEGPPPPFTNEDACDAGNAVANAIRATPAKTARGLLAHVHAYVWDSSLPMEILTTPYDDLDWGPKCLVSLMREVEGLANAKKGTNPTEQRSLQRPFRLRRRLSRWRPSSARR